VHAGNIQVLSVNGTKVVNLAHLAHLIATSTEKYTKLELEWNKVGGVVWMLSCMPAPLFSRQCRHQSSCVVTAAA
jgi:hypothetical protein